MHPVSRERIEWVKARLQLLNEMFNELRDHPTKYVTASIHSAAMSPVLTKIQEEQIQLRVELDVLIKFYSKFE